MTNLIIHEIVGICSQMRLMELIKLLFVHYVLIWPILGRLYYVTKCMEFNYSFLTQKVYPNYMLYENDLDLNNQMQSEKRTTYISKIIFFPLFSLFLLFLFFSLIPYTRCYLFAFNSMDEALLKECEGIITNFEYNFLTITRVIIDFVEISLMTTSLYVILLYPLKKDEFKFKFELISLFTIWFFSHHFYHTLSIFEIIKYDFKRGFIIDLIEDSIYILLYVYLIYKRNKINVNDFYSMLYNYDLFMQNPVCFNFLKNYIKTNAEEEYSLIFFYIDYQFYKKSFNQINMNGINRENANLFFNEFLTNGERYTKLSSTKIEASNSFTILTYSKSPMGSQQFNSIIDFPLDVIERIEEYAKEEFNCDDETLFSIFDEAFAYVNNKLYNRFLMMIRDEEEYNKLGKLICYFDFDFEIAGNKNK